MTTKSKQIAEKKSSIAEIVSYCNDMPQAQVKRMITLKQM